jgi:prepilin-type N-terminal cleavage/methylation domain-containing protein
MVQIMRIYFFIMGRVRSNHGFTLIELIVGLILLAILTAVFGLGITGALNVYAISTDNVHLAQKGQMAMARIDRELMELNTIYVRNDTDPYIIYGNLRGTGIHAIRLDSATHRLLLYSDLDTAALDPNKADELADQVAGFTLAYWQGASPWADADLRHLSHIEAHLTLSRPSGLISSDPIFTGRVYLRNTINYGGAAPTVEPPQPPTMGTYGCFIGASSQEGIPDIPKKDFKKKSFLVSLVIFGLYIGVLFIVAILRRHLRHSSEGRNLKKISGSALIAVIVSILIFSTIAAALLPLVSSSGQQSVAQDQAEKAYLLAESGFRYAAAEYLRASEGLPRMQKLDDLHGTFYQTDQGDFSLKVSSYFYIVNGDQSMGETNIETWIPGSMAPEVAAIASFSSLKLRINSSAYTIQSATVSDPQNITFTLSAGLAEAVSNGTTIYPVAGIATQQILNNGDNLSYQGGDAALFPTTNGLVFVAGRDLNYRFNNKSLNRFEGIRDLNDPSPITVYPADEILLRPHVRLESTGYYGSGGFQVSRTVDYDTPLYFSGLAERKVTFSDAFDNSNFGTNWTTLWGTQAVSNIAGNAALQNLTVALNPTPSIPRASLIALNASDAKDALRVGYLDAGNFLSYDVQIKVGFLADPYQSAFASSTYYFAGGLSFRLDTNENAYGISILRGNRNTSPPYDYIANDIVPPTEINRVSLVLWQQTNNATSSTWLAYKDIDGWPIQDTTLLVRIKEAVVLSFEDGMGAPIEKGNTVIGESSGAHGRVIQGPILDNGQSWTENAAGAAGYLLLNNISGTFQSGENLFVAGRGSALASVRAYSGQRTNVIRIFYATPDTNVCAAIGDDTPFDDVLRCYPRGTSPLLWPPDLTNDGELNWPDTDDYFRQIQWDAINTSVSNLAVQNSQVEPDAIIVYHHDSLQTPASGGLGDRPEIGLHAMGTGATNIYFDDFGLQLAHRSHAIIPTPVQQ